MTEEEFDHLAKNLKKIVEPDFVLLAEVEGDPAGFCMALPDINLVLRKLNGRLFPFGIFKLLWFTKVKNLIKANGKWYWLNFEINEMTAGRYVETATFGADVVGNLHKLMATMCTPMKWSWKGLVLDKYVAENHSKYADDMLQADFNHCYQACVFFYAVFNESMKALQCSLEGSQTEKEVLNQHLTNFKSLMDGCIMPSWLVNLKISV